MTIYQNKHTPIEHTRRLSGDTLTTHTTGQRTLPNNYDLTVSLDTKYPNPFVRQRRWSHDDTFETSNNKMPLPPPPLQALRPKNVVVPNVQPLPKVGQTINVCV